MGIKGNSGQILFGYDEAFAWWVKGVTYQESVATITERYVRCRRAAPSWTRSTALGRQRQALQQGV